MIATLYLKEINKYKFTLHVIFSVYQLTAQCHRYTLTVARTKASIADVAVFKSISAILRA